MSSDAVYALISDILGLPGRYSLDTLRAAREHVDRSFRGPDHHALLTVLKALESLIRDHEANSVRVTVEPEPPLEDSDLREVIAILEDPDFLPTKADVLAEMAKVLGEGKLKATAKDSRDVVVRKAVGAFASMSASQRLRATRMLRKRFIKTRGSSLEGWSAIISK